MLKKLLLVPLISTLYVAADQSSFSTLGIEAATLAVYTIIPKLINASSGLNAEKTDAIVTVGNRLITLAGAAVSVYAIAQLYSVGKELYSHHFPTRLQKARIADARMRNQVFEARQAFRTCLINNQKSQRDASGRPAVCEDLASMLAAIAGRSELDEITKNFKSAYKE